MRSLKKRIRPDKLVNEVRVGKRRTGRILYLIFLAAFLFGICNYLFGDYFMLRADGLVLREQHVIAPTYIARVDAVDVTEGQYVEKGQIILRLQSTEMLEHLADLSTKQAQLVASETDFKVRAQSVSQLLPIAERRETEAARVVKQFDSLSAGKFVTSARYEQALRSHYDASSERVTLFTQSKVLNQQLSALNLAQADARRALAKLQAVYADGVVRAPVTGRIGASIPSVGSVYRPGERILSVYSGAPYVLVFLPRRYLFPIHVGMRVNISDGRKDAKGVVTAILPVTESLPKEFQNTFKPTDRNQLAKIQFTTPSMFPLHQKVWITRTSSMLAEALGY